MTKRKTRSPRLSSLRFRAALPDRFCKNAQCFLQCAVNIQPIKIYYFIVCGEAQTMEWLVLLFFFFFFFFLALLSYCQIHARYRKTYENKSVDTSDIRYCAKFQPSVTNNFAKKCKNWFRDFVFLAFLIFKMTSKFKFDLIRPT